MKPMVKNALLITLGALIGGGSVYIWAKNKQVQEYNDAVDEITQKYESIINEQVQKINDKDEELGLIKANNKIIRKENYNTMDDPREPQPVYSSETGKEPDISNKESEDDMGEDQNVPHLIDEDTYTHDEEFDKRDFRYYEDDGVICDDYDNIMDEHDQSEMFGDVTIPDFGKMSKSKDTMYIRNPKNHIDYQITKFPGTYYGSLDNDDPKVKQKKMREMDE